MVTAVLTAAAVVLTLGQGGSFPLGLSSAPAAAADPTGPTPARGTTVIASVSDNSGGPLIDWSDEPAISGDGNWAVFTTDSSQCAECFGLQYEDPDPLDPESGVR